jgi:hypothetical protein
MYELNGHLLCVEHATMIQRANQAHIDSLERQREQAVDDIHRIAGDESHFIRKYLQAQARAPKVTNVNRVTNVKDSVVGVINQGTIQSLSVSMNQISNGGSPDVAKAIMALGNAIAASSLADVPKREAIDHLDFIAGEAAKPADQRKSSILRPVVTTLGLLLGTSADLTQLWDAYGPVLKAFLGLE